MLRKPIHWLLYGGIWFLMGVYYTSWDMVAYHARFLSMLPMNLCQNAVWALEGLLILRIAERFNLRVGFSCAVMPAPPDDSAAFHQDGSHHRVGRSRPIAPAGQAQRQAHAFAFQAHSPNNAPANCFASNGCKSSGCSPSPTYLIGNPSSF